jgi:hypothetical protein
MKGAARPGQTSEENGNLPSNLRGLRQKDLPGMIQIIGILIVA